jgi:hypothetical protein
MYDRDFLLCQIVNNYISWYEWLVPVSDYKYIASIITGLHAACEDHNCGALGV